LKLRSSLPFTPVEKSSAGYVKMAPTVVGHGGVVANVMIVNNFLETQTVCKPRQT